MILICCFLKYAKDLAAFFSIALVTFSHMTTEIIIQLYFEISGIQMNVGLLYCAEQLSVLSLGP